MNKWRPTNGRCIVRFHDEFAKARESGLALPDMVSDRRSTLGEVMDFRGADKSMPIKIGDAVIVPPHVAGTKIGNGCQIIRISDIAAIVEGEGQLESVTSEVPRCQYCGPAKPGTNSQGMIMSQAGPNGEYVCSRCRKDVNGNIPTEHKITDDEVYRAEKALKLRR